MSRELPASFQTQRNELRSVDPWVWLFEIAVPTVPPSRLRLAANSEPIQFGADSNGDALTWSPFPIRIMTMRNTTAGDIPSFDVQVGNPDGVLSSYVEEFGGMVGQTVKVILVNTTDLANPASRLEDRGEIRLCTVSGDQVVVSVSTYSLYQRKFPPYRFVSRTCGHQFGDVNCGYAIVAGGTNVVGGGYSTCAKSMEACGDHGADELANGLTVLHPKRFGAFRGIPRQSGSV